MDICGSELNVSNCWQNYYAAVAGIGCGLLVLRPFKFVPLLVESVQYLDLPVCRLCFSAKLIKPVKQPNYGGKENLQAENVSVLCCWQVV